MHLDFIYFKTLKNVQTKVECPSTTAGKGNFLMCMFKTDMETRLDESGVEQHSCVDTNMKNLLINPI